jgi:stress response protein YsnF
MAITKETEIAKIEVVGEYKAVQIATDTVIKEDGVEISRSRHRHVKHPHETITGENAEVQAVCNAVWTQAVKDAWNTYRASLNS